MKKSLLCSTLALAVASAAQAAPKTVDIMVLYTPAATQTGNGRDIDARIASYIEFANTAYEKSGVDLRLRLVHKQRLDWADYPTVTGANLDRFMRDPQVQRLREQYGADLVSLVNRSQNSGNGYITCGIGYMGSGEKNSGRFHGNAKDIAYNLTGVDCGLNTFAHEAGHNMGLRHSYEQDLESSYYDPRYAHSGTYEWSRGYGVQGRFATVMAYPHAFGTNKQAPFFANPRLVKAECANQPCGREEHADAARPAMVHESQARRPARRWRVHQHGRLARMVRQRPTEPGERRQGLPRQCLAGRRAWLRPAGPPHCLPARRQRLPAERQGHAQGRQYP